MVVLKAEKKKERMGVLFVWMLCVLAVRCGQMSAFFSGVVDAKLMNSATLAVAVVEQYLVLTHPVNVLFKYATLNEHTLAETNVAWCPGLSFGYVYLPAGLYVQLGGSTSTCFALTTPTFYHMTITVTNFPLIQFAEENIPPYAYDLVTVLMHEICHGLGMASFLHADGTSKFAPYVSMYDKLLFSLSTSGPFVLLSGSLTDGTLKYPFSTLDYPVYSKNPFVEGTSLVHGRYGLMKDRMPVGVALRSMDAYVLHILSDMGYTTQGCTAPDTSNVCLFCQPNVACDLSAANVLHSLLFYFY